MISLNMVVYNEGHRIFDTLDNVWPHVDEIVIVDQQSVDDTLRQVWRFVNKHDCEDNVIVLKDQHWGYCEPSRELAWRHSNGDWILVLDADERLSGEFIANKKYIMENYSGCRMMRSFWLGGEHRFTGDCQYRFFKRDKVRFLTELHTEPQPYNITNNEIYSTPWIAIYHEKSWTEQVRDELAYEQLLQKLPYSYELKKAKEELNVHLKLLRETNPDLTPEEIDRMSMEERKMRGLTVK
jgi:glycosyltransferase involved in cell wall biosynthesis